MPPRHPAAQSFDPTTPDAIAFREFLRYFPPTIDDTNPFLTGISPSEALAKAVEKQNLSTSVNAYPYDSTTPTNPIEARFLAEDITEAADYSSLTRLTVTAGTPTFSHPSRNSSTSPHLRTTPDLAFSAKTHKTSTQSSEPDGNSILSVGAHLITGPISEAVGFSSPTRLTVTAGSSTSPRALHQHSISRQSQMTPAPAFPAKTYKTYTHSIEFEGYNTFSSACTSAKPIINIASRSSTEKQSLYSTPPPSPRQKRTKSFQLVNKGARQDPQLTDPFIEPHRSICEVENTVSHNGSLDFPLESPPPSPKLKAIAKVQLQGKIFVSSKSSDGRTAHRGLYKPPKRPNLRHRSQSEPVFVLAWGGKLGLMCGAGKINVKDGNWE